MPRRCEPFRPCPSSAPADPIHKKQRACCKVLQHAFSFCFFSFCGCRGDHWSPVSGGSWTRPYPIFPVSLSYRSRRKFAGLSQRAGRCPAPTTKPKVCRNQRPPLTRGLSPQGDWGRDILHLVSLPPSFASQMPPHLRAKSRLRRLRSETRLRAQPHQREALRAANSRPYIFFRQFLVLYRARFCYLCLDGG